MRVEHLATAFVLVIAATVGFGALANATPEIPDEAFLSAGDLPGSGWRVIERDVFNEGGLSSHPDTESCNRLSAAEREILDLESFITSRVQVKLRDGSVRPSNSVEEWVEIYDAPERATRVFDLMRTVLGPDGHRCRHNDTPRTYQFTTEMTAATATPPMSGLVEAYTLTAPTGQLGFQYYFWQTGSVGVSLIVSGSPVTLQDGLVQQALDKAQARLHSLK